MTGMYENTPSPAHLLTFQFRYHSQFNHIFLTIYTCCWLYDWKIVLERPLLQKFTTLIADYTLSYIL